MFQFLLADSKGYYAILGVSERATYQEIKRCYRRLAKKYHPDKNSTIQAEDLIKRINAAFEVLSDHHKRAEYDRVGVTGIDREVVEHSADFTSSYKEHSASASYSTTEAHSDASQTRSRARSPRRRSQAHVTNEPYFGPSHIETPKGRFHIIVEPSLCMAFGSCETLAPKVFVVEKNRRVNPKARVECETCEEYDRIYAAAQTCPTKAIRIVDRYTGEQLFP